MSSSTPAPEPGSEMAMAAIIYYGMAANYDSEAGEAALARTNSPSTGAALGQALSASASLALSRLGAMHADGRGVPAMAVGSAAISAVGKRGCAGSR